MIIIKADPSTSEFLPVAESSAGPTSTSLPIGSFDFEQANEGNSNDWLTPPTLLERLAVHSDCVDGLNSLAEKSVDCVVTSPPYNIGIKYTTHNENRSDYSQWMKSVFLAIKRVLADAGHLFLQVGGIATRPQIPWLLLSVALEAGFVLQNEIVWVKSVTVAGESHGHFKPVNSNRFLNQTHEFIFHFTKTGKVPVDRLAIGVSFADKANIARFEHEKDVRCRGNVWFIPYDTIHKPNDHPAIFPVAIPEMCIKLSGVPKGSLVADPFVGSGTTLVACEKLGMRGVGFDIDESYVQFANRRLERPSLATRHEDSAAVEDEVALTPQAAIA